MRRTSRQLPPTSALSRSCSDVKSLPFSGKFHTGGTRIKKTAAFYMGQRRNQPRYVSSKEEPEQNDGISCGAVPAQREQRKNRGTRTVFRAVFRYAVSDSRQFLRKSHTGSTGTGKTVIFTRAGGKTHKNSEKRPRSEKQKRKPPFSAVFMDFGLVFCSRPQRRSNRTGVFRRLCSFSAFGDFRGLSVRALSQGVSAFSVRLCACFDAE